MHASLCETGRDLTCSARALGRQRACPRRVCAFHASGEDVLIIIFLKKIGKVNSSFFLPTPSLSRSATQTI